MPKKILLIENDTAFAAQLGSALEARGFDVRAAAEGKGGLDLAREWGPDGIVLCVELPGMSGYLVCQKLRKDENTKAIPLVLTSAEATADTFEKHKALKVRADEYLLKPFAPPALLEKLSAIGLPSEVQGEAADGEELHLEEDMALDGLGAEPAAELPSLDLESLPDEPPGAVEGAQAPVDDDLAFLDEAFDGIAAPEPPRAEPPRAEPERPVQDEELAAAAASLPAEDEAAGRAALGDLDVDDAAALSGLESADLPSPAEPAPPPPAAPAAEPPAVRGASLEALRAAGVTVLPAEPAPAAHAAPAPPAPPPARATLAGIAGSSALRGPAPGGRSPAEALVDVAQADRLQRELADARAAAAARDAEGKVLRGRVEEAMQRAEAAESAAAEREADLASVRAKLEAVSHQARKADQELKALREEARRAADELETLRARQAEAERRAEQAEALRGRIDELERELGSVNTELLVARNEAEGARGEMDARTADLRQRVSELEAQAAKHEERVLKAYQKIKGDEKVKDRIRKAIAIAAQLLEEGLPPDPASTEKERLS
ncbi:MAG TPA: response regulator [Anaeromyxobacter sp.]|nr:response regulator [Anaeromyxobacter sp.]